MAEFEGTAAADQLMGTDGDDVLRGRRGNDVLHGGPGNDVYLFDRGDGQDVVEAHPHAPGERDELRFGAGISLSDLAFSKTADGDLVVSLKGTTDSVRFMGFGFLQPVDRPLITLADGTRLDGVALEAALAGAYGQWLPGTPGADVLVGGAGSDSLQGGEGDDVLYGGGGDDTLDGGSGRDTFHFGRGDGRDTVFAGAMDVQDRDRVVFGGTVALSDLRLSIDGGALVVALQGSADTLRIENYVWAPLELRPDLVLADGAVLSGSAVDRLLNGNDAWLNGTTGNDTLVGGAHDESINGGDGDDVLYGGRGNDVLDGWSGSDTIHFGRGDGQDLMHSWGNAAGERDRIVLGHGIALSDLTFTLDGGLLTIGLKGSTDSLRVDGWGNAPIANRADVQLSDGTVLDAAAIAAALGGTPAGTPGDDVLLGGAGSDLLAGGEGNDVLSGGKGDDVLDGGPGSDTYHFARGDGRDVVFAHGNAPGERDRIVLGQGIALSDLTLTLDGGALLIGLKGSSDTVRVEGWSSVSVEDRASLVLADGTVVDGAALTKAADPWTGSPSGTPVNDVLIGRTGDDMLFGAEGDDVLYGGRGDDVLDGGLGSDTFHFGRGDGQDWVLTSGNAPGDRDRIVFGQGIAVSDLDFSLDGGALVIGLKGSTDSVRIDGWNMNGIAARPTLVLADGTEIGSQAIDAVLHGDTAHGSSADDVLIGRVTEDILVGGDGDDVLYGGQGNDFLDGGAGSDRYHFARGDGQDVAMSYGNAPGERDRLVLGRGIGLSDLRFTLDGGSLIVGLKGGSDSVRLDGWVNAPFDQRADLLLADGTVIGAVAIELALNGDTPFGTPADDVLLGGAGSEMLSGGEGNDVLYGGKGNDLLDGGPGSDTYHFARGDGQDVVLSYGNVPGERDRVVLGHGIALSDLTFALEGGALVVGVKGSSDRVRIDGWAQGASDDRASLVLADGTVLDGAALTKAVDPWAGSPYGTPADDVLVGGAGNDMLYGGQGNDVLYGGQGKDLLDGGAGSDTYHFGRGDGQDLVVTWAAAPGERDRVMLGHGIGVADLGFTLDGGALVVGLKGSSDSVRLEGWAGSPFEQRADLVLADGTVIPATAIGAALDPYAGGERFGTAGDDLLIGSAGNDRLVGADGNDVLYGGRGNDELDGGAGSDTFHFGRGDGQDKILGYANRPGDRDRVVLGHGILLSDLDFTLDAGSLVVAVDGGADSLRIEGWTGQPVDQRIGIEFADGTVVSAQAILGAIDPWTGVPNGTAANEVLIGRTTDDTLYGEDGDDVLHGRGGKDLLIGGAGADTYVFDRGDGEDTALLLPGAGRDRVQLGRGLLLSDLQWSQQNGSLVIAVAGTSDVLRVEGYFSAPVGERPTVTLADGTVLDDLAVARLVDPTSTAVGGGTSAADVLIGGNNAEVLVGGDGDDVLYGRAGDDLLDGGAGRDTIHIGRGDGKDTVLAGAGDRIQFGRGLTLDTLSARADGKDLVIVADGTNDSVRLVGWFDTPEGDRATVVFADGSAWAAKDLDREALNRAPLLVAPIADADAEQGRLFQVFVGGAFTGPEADDRLTLSVSLASGAPLPSWLKFDAATATLSGTPPTGFVASLDFVVTAIDGFGAKATDTFGVSVAPPSLTLNGTAGVNSLTGGAGHDKLYGLAGNDTLVGNAGNDLLDGGLGIDTMSGGVGNDVYIVDNASDRVTENANQGTDRVEASISYTLGVNVENLTLTGTAGLTGYGNAVDNVLAGNAGNNLLMGYAGNDTLIGGAGADTLVGGAGNDTYRVGRGSGADLIDDNDATAGNNDTLRFGSDVDADQLWFRRNGNNLEVSVIGTSDRAVISNWYGGSRYHVETFVSGDGRVLLDSQVDALVNAMAAFAPPASGQTTLPPSYQASLESVIAVNWKP